MVGVSLLCQFTPRVIGLGKWENPASNMASFLVSKPLKTNMTLENPPSSIGNTSSFMVDFPLRPLSFVFGVVFIKFQGRMSTGLFFLKKKGFTLDPRIFETHSKGPP